jgi:hypothetical protein
MAAVRRAPFHAPSDSRSRAMTEKDVVADLIKKTADKPSPREPPRLRIHHLLLWIAITAGWLLVMRQLHSDRMAPAVLLFLQITNGLEVGAATTIGLLAIAWMLRGLRSFDQPGQWLAVLPVFEPMFAALAFFVGMLVFRFTGEHSDWPRTIVSHGWPMAAVCFVLSWRISHSLLWRIFFIAAGLLALGPFYGWVLGIRIVFLRAEVFAVWWAPACILALASMDDARQHGGRRLHWTHWAGIAIWLFGVVIGQVDAILR